MQPPALLSPSVPAGGRPVPAVSWGTGGPRDPFSSAEREGGLAEGPAAFLSVGGCVKVLRGCEAEGLSPLGACCGQRWQGSPAL